MRFRTAGVGTSTSQATTRPLPVPPREQLLSDDPLDGRGDLHPDLLLLVGREDIDHAVDGLRGILRVKGGEDQVAGLCCRQGGLDGLQIAHLPHEDHVRVLTQHRPERPVERLGVGAHLALVDDAALVAVQELDRILDGHDVLFPHFVDLVDQAPRAWWSCPNRWGR